MAAPALPRLTSRRMSYQLMILVLTLISLMIMVLLLLPLSEEVHRILFVYDNILCAVFLLDFFFNLARAESKRDYFITRDGWLDLVGSIPSVAPFRFTALFRLARLSRMIRVGRRLRDESQNRILADVLANRGEYAAVITLLSAFSVLVTASILVLVFESRSENSNIETGGDALWWGVVTLTTVGYGDTFPVTMFGRLTGVFVMFAGVGIIGALASILSSVLLPPPKARVAEQPETPGAPPETNVGGTVEEELSRLREEIAALRQSLLEDRPLPPV